ncbi:MAG: MATE family efflux transporter [Clostridia bacterium]|nr:MATE family efflux transporter [Clostridia bacterium]
MRIRENFFGDKRFYYRVIAIAVPIILQNGITNFVSLLDNIMVGSLGTEQMSGVSIVNQFIFIFNLLIYGAISGAGIFCVQYHGTRDQNGISHTFRFKLYLNVLLTVLSIGAFALFGDYLISTFLSESSTSGDIVLTFSEGQAYLRIMLIGLIPYSVSQVYASTLRETEHTVVPMVASVVAVATNFVLNYILIFGKLGLDPMGVEGAAIATVASRFTELLILVVWSHRNTDKCLYFKGVFKSFSIPTGLVKRMLLKTLPLMANEFFWSISMTLRNQCYSTRGIDVVAAQNICSTIFNVFSVVYMSFGTVISIMVGSLLGQGRFKEAKDTNRKVLVCSVFCGITLGVLLTVSSGIFPELYNTDDNVKSLAAYMMIISGVYMPFYAFNNSSYFTIRSGGSVGITFIMDSGFMCLFMLPVSFIVSRFTSVDIYALFVICQGAEALKATISFFMLKKSSWTKRLVGEKN